MLKLMEEQIGKLDALYRAGETDLLTVLAVRRRLLEAGYQELEMSWTLTLAYAELLEATGGLGLLDGGSENLMPTKGSADGAVR